ncbi:DNA polymerase delta subunit 3-like [Oncorhynchus nerka]|uniref:DNA polymerase delta subunit 3-like n=1 Tax=Oncorhynchus nerka TaxID=8023 RepID=UPI0031B870E0
MDDLSLDNIDEFVNDQNKIVTYKWLSLTLGVHVNLAKQLLYHYLDRKRNESSALLHATYLVSGKFVKNDTTCHKVSSVQEDQLEDVKSKQSLTVSVHGPLYSVQTAVLKDSGPLYSADYDAVKENLRNCSRYSAIHCADAVPMSSTEVQQAHEMTQAPPPETLHTKSGINGHSSLASKPTSKQSKGVMGMFANKNVSKNQESSKEVDEKPSSPVPKAETPVKEELPKGAVVEKDISSKSKRLDHSDSEEKKNKRRRIKKPQSDSTDDEVIPDSPPRLQDQRGPSPSLLNQELSDCKTRKRRPVLKPRTFLDEGCIVTEKGYEIESYSETEDDFKASKPSQMNPDLPKPSTGKKGEEKRRKNVAASNKSTKQASIMGFFQKK